MKTYEMKNFRNTGEALILVGALLNTILQVLLVICTFGLWLIPAAIIIPLIWVSRAKVVGGKYSLGWNVTGFILAIGVDVFGAIGHLLVLIAQVNDVKARESYEYLEAVQEEIEGYRELQGKSRKVEDIEVAKEAKEAPSTEVDDDITEVETVDETVEVEQEES